MPEEEEIIGIVKIKPEPSKAIFAVEAAADLVRAAKNEIDRKKYDDAYEDARNAIRMASAGMMYNEGYLASTQEGAYAYIEKKHGDKNMAEGWKKVEVRSPQNRGLIDKILEFLRLKKGAETIDELGARKALAVAEVYVQSARSLIFMGSVPGWERTVMKE